MDFSVYLMVLFVSVPSGHTQSFFSKLFNRSGNVGNDVTNNFEEDCKLTKIMPRKISLAVIGGSVLRSKNSAPYIVALGERLRNGSIEWFCGGSILTSQTILTAAHCLANRNVDTIRIGSFNLSNKRSDKDFDISSTSIHPGYEFPKAYDDIAVVKLNQPISFSENSRPICLSSDDTERYERKRARVIGWGAEEVGGEGSHELQQVEVEIFTNEDCDKAYLNSSITPKTFPSGIREKQLCAGSSEGGKDACQGDSGGPLVLSDSDGVIRQVGIVSSGAGCGFKLYPGVYVRVSSYYKWIQEQIKSFTPTAVKRDDTGFI